MPARHYPVGPALPNERAAIEFLREHLPSDHVLVTNVELRTRDAARTFEHDAIVVGPWAVFAIELKSYSGHTRGNRDRWFLEGGQVIQSPIQLQNQKARVLKGLLQEHSFRLRSVWVQSIVCLTAPGATRDLTKGYGDIVLTRADLIAAITDRRAWPRATDLDHKQRRDIETVLRDLGEHPQLDTRLGPCTLLEQLPDRGTRYVAWRGQRHSKPRTLHVYAVRGGDPKSRQRAREVALREADLHERLRGGPGLIAYYDLDKVPEPEERIVLSFEDTSGLLPIPDWLARHRPGHTARLLIAQRITEALRFVHRKDIVHRRLRPDAVLVDDTPAPDEVRLYAFELARDLSHQLATVSNNRWRDADHVATAPELLRGAEATRRSDRYALGATLYALLGDAPAYPRAEAALTGEPPASLRLHGEAWPGHLETCLQLLVDPDPLQRPELDEVLEALGSARQAPPPRRRELAAGDSICRVYELLEPLGEGATGTTWKVQHQHDGQIRVAKVARDPDAAQSLLTEADVLQAVQHPHLVRYHSREPHQGTTVVFTELIDGVDGTDWALLADAPSPAKTRALGEALFGALGALHRAGWLHRDVKPANVLLTEPDARLTLIDLGLAGPLGARTALTVGTSAYKDPALFHEQAWTPRDDLFAAWLTLWHLLTNAHPFGGPPALGAEADLDPTHLPDTLNTETRARLATAVARALHAVPARRPADAAAATAAWRDALAEPQVEAPAPMPRMSVPAPQLPDDLTADTPIDLLPLSVRADRARRYLGLAIAGQLVRMPLAELRGVPNVGRKTVAELRVLMHAVAERLGQRPAPEAPRRPLPAPAPGLYPPLAHDERPLTALGPALTPSLSLRLTDDGVCTIGALASLPERRLLALRGVGAKRLDTVLEGLRALAGDTPPPGTLAELDARLQAELKGRYATLAAVYGLRDARARTQSEAAEHLGLTRQGISANLDLTTLRSPASVGHQLTQIVEQALPPVGFATLATTATRLSTQLPTASAHLSLLGYARLAAGLLDAEHTARHAPDLIWASRPPWTPADIELLQQALAHAANWPPVAPEALAELLWERAGELDRLTELRAAGLTPRDLLATVRPLCEHVRQTPEGHLFTPPVTFLQALTQQKGSPRLHAPLPQVLDALRSIYGGLQDPEDAAADLATIGLTLHDGHVVPKERPQPAPKATLRIDGQVRTRTLAHGARPALEVRELVAAAESGGFRVVALPPARHEALADELATALTAALGADRVRTVDLDAVLLDTAHAADLWADALFEERRPHPDWSWLRDDLTPALRAAITGEARPGVLTLLTRPTLLGDLGLMDWLGRLYEDARGGRYGLLVLALPGSVYDGRVRLNDAWPLAYTPDMAAVVYREAI